MNKTVIILLTALAASFSVYAGVELRSSFVDKTHNTFIVEVVDTETNEVIESRTFQYNDAGDAILVVSSTVSSSEEIKIVEDAVVVNATSGFVIDLPTVETVATELDVDGDSVDANQIGIWDAVKQKLEASQASLTKALAYVENKYNSLTSSETTDQGESSDAHESEGQEALVVVPADGENTGTVLDKEAKVSLPK